MTHLIVSMAAIVYTQSVIPPKHNYTVREGRQNPQSSVFAKMRSVISIKQPSNTVQ